MPSKRNATQSDVGFSQNSLKPPKQNALIVDCFSSVRTSWPNFGHTACRPCRKLLGICHVLVRSRVHVHDHVYIGGFAAEHSASLSGDAATTHYFVLVLHEKNITSCISCAF